MNYSKVYAVRQNFPQHTLEDIPGTVAQQLAGAGFASRLEPGSSVAIGVGSRGITNLATIVRAIVAYWNNAGMKPFIFPAMGSHGAATAEGQADVLAHYGIIEETMGCPVRSSLDVAPVARTAEGIQTYMDRNAFESHGVMLCGRVKWHTDFEGPIESGLFKMMAIGLGKFAGAQHYHTFGYKHGLGHTIESIGRAILGSGKILGGLAILEDAYHNTAELHALPVEVMEQRERELLARVKTWMPRIPMDLDILILDEIGKNISGAGMDTKIVNRGVHGDKNNWHGAPKIQRIFVRDLSELSYGNASGFGLADMVTDRLVSHVEWTSTYINALTSSALPAVKTPIHFASDRECLDQLAPSVGKFSKAELRIGWIRNTMELSPIVLTENLIDEIKANPLLEILDGPMPLEFDAEGNLSAMLPSAPLLASH
ncbi:MAG TPA: hypothetical protein DEQ47_16415 [Solibacterales bacterium]|nr:hypothetical protein [Bryobacterales bacterium]